MSFSGEVKKELCRAPLQRKCCALAESCGVLLYAGTFSLNEVRIVTESEEFAQRLPKLFQKAFSVKFDVLPDDGASGKLIFRIHDVDKLAKIWRELGYDPEQHFALHVNFALLEEEHCRSAFLRGAFLAGGSVTDPRKRYHLELSTVHLQVGRETEALLRDMDFEPKNVLRGGSTVTYFKHSANIEDILTLLGAPSAAMEIMAAKVEKSMRNTVNRRVNCDAANLDKSVAASQAQVEALTRLTESGILKTLSAELQEVAVARLLQPELSLSELAETFDPPLTKSCLNHRMRKLVQLAKEERK
ncbi:MAG: DNA-binding protein WhiA [Ruminococcaceae bacterium]|nr:DNA-binding protein WhiA [Oscillospiraceae bacterium]